MTVLVIVIAVVLFLVVMLIAVASAPLVASGIMKGYVYSARLLGDGLAEALSKNIWTSRAFLVGLYAARGAVTAILVDLVAVQLVKSPETALTVTHASKVGLTIGGLYVLALAARACMRAETVTSTLADLGEDPIVLFLRSFPTDSSIADPALAVGAPGYSEEQDMAALFGTVAPFVALARPRAAQELGAIRVPASDQQWRATVTSLVSRAKVVVVRLGVSEGLIWELQLLASLQPRLPVLFLLPDPPAEGEPDPYVPLAIFLPESTGWKFPLARKSASALFFSATGEAVLLYLLRRRHLDDFRRRDLYESLIPFFEASGVWPRQIALPRMVFERILLAGLTLYLCLLVLLAGTVGLRWGG